ALASTPNAPSPGGGGGDLCSFPRLSSPPLSSPFIPCPVGGNGGHRADSSCRRGGAAAAALHRGRRAGGQRDVRPPRAGHRRRAARARLRLHPLSAEHTRHVAGADPEGQGRRSGRHRDLRLLGHPRAREGTVRLRGPQGPGRVRQDRRRRRPVRAPPHRTLRLRRVELRRLPAVAALHPRHQVPHRQRAFQGGDAALHSQGGGHHEGGGAVRVAGRAHHLVPDRERIRQHRLGVRGARKGVHAVGGRDGRLARHRRALGHVPAGRRAGPPHQHLQRLLLRPVHAQLRRQAQDVDRELERLVPLVWRRRPLPPRRGPGLRRRQVLPARRHLPELLHVPWRDQPRPQLGGALHRHQLRLRCPHRRVR
ncbi:Beta-galactosidase, partial [Zea mays]